MLTCFGEFVKLCGEYDSNLSEDIKKKRKVFKRLNIFAYGHNISCK